MIPSSLSPHITVLSSPDLDELLEASSLPSLANILQSFSPLPQVTTRTTALTSVPHASFALRFSQLQEVEQACKEDDDQRASRTIDWITARISKRCARWVQEADRLDKDAIRTPWWDELRRCSEGDVIPSKHEGWNHPVAVILAVSTTAPNPLQAITTLHSRTLQLPPWVDNNFIKYTLIIHPERSSLSNEEAGALFNAVKKQYGLHSYLLPLTLPQPAPPPVPVPAILPRLPSPPSPDSSQRPTTPTTPNVADPSAGIKALNTLRMQEQDIQHTARFTREFVVMSLVPWMEKCTLEWNENFSSTRRLPSRLFSSTRRLFGSPSPSPAPNLVATAMGAPGRSNTLPVVTAGGPSPPSQQRRLAEFATILGDYKLAVTVWEALRKDSKGGSDILPLLLSPSPSLQTLAETAVMSIHPTPTELPPQAQVRSLLTAVRWEGGISNPDFISSTLDGEQWLVWAAGNAEEVPSALLLAQAAFLSAKKRATRRAALCYVVAAMRLEKCGIKPLTVHFLRKARELYDIWPPKELSPSFWESEGKAEGTREGLEDIYSGIEHPLGRLLYTTGDVSGAVQIFLGLLRGASTFTPSPVLPIDNVPKPSSSDKLYLEDFRVAYNYFKTTESDIAVRALSLNLPIKLCVAKSSKLKFPTERDGETMDSWTARLDDWKTFWRSKGEKASLAEAGKVYTHELFWVDLVLYNPLDAEITLSNLTVVVQQGKQNDYTPVDFVEVEVLKEIVLPPRQHATIPISLSSSKAATLNITHARYDFLGLLPCTESLTNRGRRLHDTPAQRQRPTYAADVVMRVDVLPSNHKLDVQFLGGDKMVFLQGETKQLPLILTNSGSNPIREAWLIVGPRDEIWIGKVDKDNLAPERFETWKSSNSLVPQEPFSLPITSSNMDSLEPGGRIEIPAIVHTETVGSQAMEMVCVFREDGSGPFHITKVLQRYEVHPLFDVTARSEPSLSKSHSFVIDMAITNTSPSTTVELSQITSLSARWSLETLADGLLGQVPPGQCTRVVLCATPWMEGSGSSETMAYVSKKLGSLLQGLEHEATTPPSLDLRCSHITNSQQDQSAQDASIMSFIHTSRLDYGSRHISNAHPYIPKHRHASMFPMYHPNTVHLVVFWEDVVHHRSGHINVHGLTLGAGHGALAGILEEVETAKVKRSMYAETRKENLDIIEAIRNSEWNSESESVVVSVQRTNHRSHNFEKGPYNGSVDLNLRNHSLTRPVRYTLKLHSETTSGSLLAPPYKGRLTFHGTLDPSQIVTLTPKIWIRRPGAYALGGWILETEIIPDSSARSTKPIRHIQESPPDTELACIIISDNQSS
ncbi:ER-golgi trafficking TRAPP I complex 85 kDa subunit-domain-containing protein [Panaeolus papilionaceus]|nr:ER-golgi trafficking TRAPP I complex 85 kDa subunit-domain-containing protein [Panaeolus papilionaceus]